MNAINPVTIDIEKYFKDEFRFEYQLIQKPDFFLI